MTSAFSSSPFYDAHAVFPEIVELCRGHVKGMRKELTALRKQASAPWKAWPETYLYNPVDGDQWTVLPFVHTFPGDDPSKTTWLEGATEACPQTRAFLRAVPHLRTALVSVMSPGMCLKPHQGWACLSNHVLRMHLPLALPEADADGFPSTGLVVNGVTQYHTAHDLVVFDDSLPHYAFNNHCTQERMVLIFDVARPASVAPGSSQVLVSTELQSFLDYFR